MRGHRDIFVEREIAADDDQGNESAGRTLTVTLGGIVMNRLVTAFAVAVMLAASAAVAADSTTAKQPPDKAGQATSYSSSKSNTAGLTKADSDRKTTACLNKGGTTRQCIQGDPVPGADVSVEESPGGMMISQATCTAKGGKLAHHAGKGSKWFCDVPAQASTTTTKPPASH